MATNRNGNGNGNGNLNKETFNLSDMEPAMYEAGKALAQATATAQNKLEFLADCARKDWRVNDSLAGANIVLNILKQGNKIWLEKFVANFAIYCGCYMTKKIDGGAAIVKDSKIAAMYVTKTKDNPELHWIAAPTDYNSKRNEALARAKNCPLYPENLATIKAVGLTTEGIALAKKRYNSVLTTLKALRNSVSEWEDTEESTAIFKLLDAAAIALPELSSDYIKNQIKALVELNNPEPAPAAPVKTRKQRKSA